MSGGPAPGWQLRFESDRGVLEPRSPAAGATVDACFRRQPNGGRWESPAGALIYAAIVDPEAATLTLSDASEAVAGSASTTEPLGETGGVYYFLLADGRLFRLAPSGTRAGGFDLTGWDLPGPYLIARPDSAGWNFLTQPAGRELEDLRILMFLVATRIITDDGMQTEWTAAAGLPGGNGLA